VKTQMIVGSDLIPYMWWELKCQGCETTERWRVGPFSTKIEAVIAARRLGWERLEINGQMRTFCCECAAFWKEDGGTH
jgi:hypothetical protein